MAFPCLPHPLHRTSTAASPTPHCACYSLTHTLQVSNVLPVTPVARTPTSVQRVTRHARCTHAHPQAASNVLPVRLLLVQVITSIHIGSQLLPPILKSIATIGTCP